MSFNTWWDNNSGNLGVVSLGWDLNKCWKASKSETKKSIKQKISRIISNPKIDAENTDIKYIKEELKKL